LLKFRCINEFKKAVAFAVVDTSVVIAFMDNVDLEAGIGGEPILTTSLAAL
jgi:hypothetical protein